MEPDDLIYSNVPSSFTPAKSQLQDTKGGKKGGILWLIAVCILLFLSLLANAILTYLYCKIKLAPSPSPLQKMCSSEPRIEHWIQRKDASYVFSQDKMSWNSSRQRCQELGGDLVIVNNQEEHEFLAKTVGTIGNSALHWIGLTDAKAEGKWLWLDHTPLKENLMWWAYPPDDWKEHDPLGEDCAVYFKGGWGDVSCLIIAKRICEFSCTLESP